MAGWNLKEAVCIKENPSDEEFWHALEHFYRHTHKTATYKFCFLKCLLDCTPESGLELTFKNIFNYFTEIYWDLIVKYDLWQIYVNSRYKKSKIEIIIEQIVTYCGNNKKIGIYELPFEVRKKLIHKVTQYCSQNVIGAFYESTYGLFYSFSKNEKSVIFTKSAKSFLERYKKLIEEINYFNWAKMIEKINGNEVPTTFITKLSKLNVNKDLSLLATCSLKNEKEFSLRDILPLQDLN